MSKAGVKPAATDDADPVLARWLLTAMIRQLVKADGRGPNALAEAAGVAPATIKRWIAGSVQVGAPQVFALMAALEIDRDDPRTLTLLGLAADARKNNVTTRPEWATSTALDLLVSLERVSEAVQTFELTVIPGLLQTEDYARAHLVLAGWTDALEERVQFRMDRQQILDKGVRYAAIVDEATLHRPPGASPEVMRGQLAHLVDMAERPNVTLQVIPFANGPYFTGGNGPYTMLESKLVGRRITSVETSMATMLLETTEANDRYADAWSRLAARASGPEESLKTIRSLL